MLQLPNSGCVTLIDLVQQNGRVIRPNEILLCSKTYPVTRENKTSCMIYDVLSSRSRIKNVAAERTDY